MSKNHYSATFAAKLRINSEFTSIVKEKLYLWEEIRFLISDFCVLGKEIA
jgi:hypothetical protein